MEDSKKYESGKLDVMLTLWRELTWTRGVMTVAFGLTAVILFYVYEHRDSAVPAMLENNLAMFGLMLALVLGVVATVGGRLLKAVQDRADASERALMDSLHREMKAINDGLDECRAREVTQRIERAEMQREIDALKLWIAKAKVILAQAGLEIP